MIAEIIKEFVEVKVSPANGEMIVTVAEVVMEVELAEPGADRIFIHPDLPGGIGKGHQVADIQAETENRGVQFGKEGAVDHRRGLVGVFKHHRSLVMFCDSKQFLPGFQGILQPGVQLVTMFVLFESQVTDDGPGVKDWNQLKGQAQFLPGQRPDPRVKAARRQVGEGGVQSA